MLIQHPLFMYGDLPLAASMDALPRPCIHESAVAVWTITGD